MLPAAFATCHFEIWLPALNSVSNWFMGRVSCNLQQQLNRRYQHFGRVEQLQLGLASGTTGTWSAMGQRCSEAADHKSEKTKWSIVKREEPYIMDAYYRDTWWIATDYRKFHKGDVITVLRQFYAEPLEGILLTFAWLALDENTQRNCLVPVIFNK